MKKHDMELANKLNSDLSMAIESGSAMAGKLKNSNLKNYLFSHVGIKEKQEATSAVCLPLLFLLTSGQGTP